MLAPEPATSSVNLLILSLTALKSVYFFPWLSFSKTAYGFPSECPKLPHLYVGPYVQVEAQVACV